MIDYFESRLTRLTLILCFSAALAGCGGFLSGAGPYKGSIENAAQAESPEYELIEISARTIGPYMRPEPPGRIAAISPTDAVRITLMPGDVVGIMIADSVQEGGIFAPLAQGGSQFEMRVDADGRISLPYAGRPKVDGLTLPEVEEKLRTALSGTAAEAQVVVHLVGDRSGSVLVAGAVKQPGRFSALQGPLTLLDAINMAGGPTLEPHLINVVVRNGTDVNTYSYHDILEGKNEPVAPRSEIVVERALKRFVAMGAVRDPGLHDLPSQSPSLLETLGSVGGLDERAANPQGVFVFRLASGERGGEPTPQVFQLDMRNPAAIFLARRFLMRPDDAIYVTNAAMHEWQKIISPIVQVLVLGRTLN